METQILLGVLVGLLLVITALVVERRKFAKLEERHDMWRNVVTFVAQRTNFIGPVDIPGEDGYTHPIIHHVTKIVAESDSKTETVSRLFAANKALREELNAYKQSVPARSPNGRFVKR